MPEYLSARWGSIQRKPIFTGGIVGGMVADRFGPKPVLITDGCPIHMF
jgi:hypothetical protein